MPDRKGGLPRFFHELKRRRVARSLLVYLASAFAVLEATDILIPVLGLPGWALQAVVVVLALGIPVTLVVSWNFDLTTRGFVQTEPMAPQRPLAPSDSTDTSSSPSYTPVRPATWFSPGSVALVVFFVSVGIVGGWLLEPLVRGGGPALDPTTAPPPARTSIAVLPLENRSVRDENRFFADAIHEEVLANLARIGDLRVIPRISVLDIDPRERDIREIADELGVGTIATGSVQRSGEQVRITFHLIDPFSNDELWGESYERTLDDVFAVQAEIAQNVASTLAATLSPQAEARIQAPPTDQQEAYLAYLDGAERLTRAIRTFDPGELAGAVQALQRATEVDSDFAMAHAWLSVAHEWSFRAAGREGPRAEHARGARVAAETALSLDPGLPEAHFAMAFQGSQMPGSQQRTLEDLDHLNRALEGIPNSAPTLRELAVRNFRLASVEVAAQFSDQAVDLVRGSALYQLQAGEMARLLRNFEKADFHLRLATGLSSDAPEALAPIFSSRMHLELARGGGTAALESLLQEELARSNSDSATLRLHLLEFPELLSLGDRADFVDGLSPGAGYAQLPQDLLRLKAWQLEMTGRGEGAESLWASVADRLRRGGLEDEGEWTDALARIELALSLARAGEDAEARSILESLTLPEARSSQAWEFNLLRAQANAELGEMDAAAQDLIVLLRSPTGLTPETLKARAVWDPIRDHATFRALLGG